MSEKLKPCPFCGGEAELGGVIKPILNEHRYQIACNYCGGQTLFFQSVEEAIKAWNTRAEAQS